MICVALKGQTADEMVARAAAALSAGAHMVEFRIDTLIEPSAEALRKLSAVRALKIATLKGRSLELMRRKDAAELLSPFDYVDIELEDVSRVRLPQQLVSRLVVSHHGPMASPGELESVIRAELRAGAVAKCVGTRGSFAEASLYAGGAEGFEKQRVMTFSTGAAGLLSRLASLRNGAPWTYASLSEGERTADGQPVLSDLADLQDGLLNVLIGADVSRSPSPVIQNYALGRHRLRGRYIALSLGSREELEPFFTCARAAGVRGINVTMPYKTDVLPFMSAVDDQAGRIGAVNTVVVEGDRLVGYNTDYTAVSRLLNGQRHGRVLLIGSGGAARSAAEALHGSDITILSRDAARGTAMALSMGFENNAFEAGGSYDIIVNCTPAGMDGRRAPLPDGVTSCTFRTVMDFVYSKKKTSYRMLAEEQSCRYIGGAEILANQAAASFRLWTGTDAPLDDMLSILRKEGFS